jgi:hypothetical protein
MSLSSFQRAVVEMTLAPRHAQRLINDDLRVADAYDLTDREVRRLRGIVEQPGMSVNCTIARGNRFEVIGDLFPMTCVLLEPVLRELLEELWEDFPSGYQLAGEDAAFVSNVRQKIAGGELRIEYLDEIFTYEEICLQLARQMRNQADEDCELKSVIEFRHSPELLLTPLSKLEAPPPGLPSGSYRAGLVLRNMRFYVEMLPE